MHPNMHFFTVMVNNLTRPLPSCSEHCWPSWHCSPNHNRSVTTYEEAVVPCRCHQGQSLGGGPVVPDRPTAPGLPPATSGFRAVAGHGPRDSPSTNDSSWCGTPGCCGPARVRGWGLHHQCQVSAFCNFVLMCSSAGLIMQKEQMYVHVCVYVYIYMYMCNCVYALPLHCCILLCMCCTHNRCLNGILHFW